MLDVVIHIAVLSLIVHISFLQKRSHTHTRTHTHRFKTIHIHCLCFGYSKYIKINLKPVYNAGFMSNLCKRNVLVIFWTFIFTILFLQNYDSIKNQGFN